MSFSIFQDRDVILSPMPTRKTTIGIREKENTENAISAAYSRKSAITDKKRKSLASRRVSFAPKTDVRVFERDVVWESEDVATPPRKFRRGSPPPLSFVDDSADDSLMQLTDTIEPQSVQQALQDPIEDEETMELTEAVINVPIQQPVAEDDDESEMEMTQYVGGIVKKEEESDDEMEFTRAAGQIVLPQNEATASPLHDDTTRFSSIAGDLTENFTSNFTRFSMISMASNNSQAVDVTDKVTHKMMAEMAAKFEKVAAGYEDMTSASIPEAEKLKPEPVEEEEENETIETVIDRAFKSSTSQTSLDFAEFSRLAGVRFLTDLTAAVSTTDSIKSVVTDQLGDGEAVGEACIQGPRYENLNWGITQLTNITQSMSDVVGKLEQGFSSNNPKIYHAMHTANSDDLLPLQQHVKKLQTMENLRSHLLWYEWKLKLERSINKSILSSFDELTNDASIIQVYESKIKELMHDIGLDTLKLKLGNQLHDAQTELRNLEASEEQKLDVSDDLVNDLDASFTMLENIHNWQLEQCNDDHVTMSFPHTGVRLTIHLDTDGNSIKIDADLRETNPIMDLIIKSADISSLLPSTLKSVKDALRPVKFVLGRCLDLYISLIKIRKAGASVSVCEDGIQIVNVSKEYGAKYRMVLQDVSPHASHGCHYALEEVFGDIDLSDMRTAVESVPGGYGWLDSVGQVLSKC